MRGSINPWKLPPVLELVEDLHDFFYRQLGPHYRARLADSRHRACFGRRTTVLAFYPEAVRRGFLRRNSNGIERSWRARLDRAVCIVQCAEIAGVNLALGDVLHWLALPKPMKTVARDDVQPLSHNDLRPCFMRTPNPCKAIDAALAVPIVARRTPPPDHVERLGGFSEGDFAQSLEENLKSDSCGNLSFDI